MRAAVTLAGSVLSNTKLPVATGEDTPATSCEACIVIRPSPRLSSCAADKVCDQLPADNVGVRSSAKPLLPMSRKLRLPLPLTCPVSVIGVCTDWLYSC